MGYKGGELADLAAPLERGVHRVGRSITDRAGKELLRRVRRHTPIAKPGTAAITASYGSSAAWIRARGGRRPGHLLESWKIGEVSVSYGGDRRVVEVYTMDPVAPFVEWDTMPHLIRAKRAGTLTIPTAQGMLFMREVHHPGTRGVHMMATAVAEVAAEWELWGREEWDRVARSIWRAAA